MTWFLSTSKNPRKFAIFFGFNPLYDNPIFYSYANNESILYLNKKILFLGLASWCIRLSI